MSSRNTTNPYFNRPSRLSVRELKDLYLKPPKQAPKNEEASSTDSDLSKPIKSPRKIEHYVTIDEKRVSYQDSIKLDIKKKTIEEIKRVE